MKNFYSKLLLGSIMLSPAVTFAASPFLKPIKDLLGDLEIFINFLNWALPALAVIVFMVLIIVFIYQRINGQEGGFKASGNILYALIGLAVLFTVYGLIQLLGALVGIDTNRAKTITAPSLPQVGGVRGGGYYYGN